MHPCNPTYLLESSSGNLIGGVSHSPRLPQNGITEDLHIILEWAFHWYS